MRKLITLSLLFSFPTFSYSQDIASCLTTAYSQILSIKDNTVYFANGNTQLLGSDIKRNMMEILKKPTIREQFSVPYYSGFKIPKMYESPGRIRNDLFFKNLYGKTEQEIKANLVSVYWEPSKSKVSFNKLNNAASQLEKVGKEIAKHPELVSYVNKTLGTFNFRKIAGTNRLSPHSFGIAIDFTLPKNLHQYWRWSGCTSENSPCPYPEQLIKDENLKKVVGIFEKYGFIWGGKWANYDSVHFEYRPELLNSQCY